MTPKTATEVRAERRQTVDPASPLLTVGFLWVRNDLNVGTMARTCDAVGADLALPDTPAARRALDRGNTIGVHNSRVHFVDPLPFLSAAADSDVRIVGLEIAHGAIPLPELPPADRTTLLVVGHESRGIPDEAWLYLQDVCEIPMVGVGNSLNVVVAASLAAYKLVGMI